MTDKSFDELRQEYMDLRERMAGIECELNERGLTLSDFEGDEI